MSGVRLLRSSRTSPGTSAVSMTKLALGLDVSARRGVHLRSTKEERMDADMSASQMPAIAQDRFPRMANPSPLRSEWAPLRPAMAKISEISGPDTSGPSPLAQALSVARSLRPAIRRFAPIRMFVFL
jgi:hypothetical protein